MKKTSPVKHKSVLIKISVFVIICIICLTLFSFTDWDISQILAKHWLSVEQHRSSNFYANLIQIIGCLPFSLMISLASMIFIIYFYRNIHNRLIQITTCILVQIVSISILTFEIYYEVALVINSLIGDDKTLSIGDVTIIVILSFLVASLLNVLFYLIINKIDTLKLKSLLLWAFMVIVGAIMMYFVVAFFKNCFPRERYRDIIFNGGGKENFAPWYKFHWNPMNPLETDAYKSRPSAHTSYAACVYAFLFLPSLQKRKRIIINTCCVFVVGCVAVGRIMSGAHYASDVFLGGTITFLLFLSLSQLFRIQKINQSIQTMLNLQLPWITLSILYFLFICLCFGFYYHLC